MKRAKKNSTKLRHEAVRKEYHKLSSVRKNGVRKHHEEWILKELKRKHFYSEQYLLDIINHRV